MSIKTSSAKLRSTAGWPSSCCWWSATTSARPACRTATASCRRWRKLGITHVRYSYNNPRLPVDMTPSALCARSQSLHPVHALRASLRRSGGRECVGGRLARHLLAHRQRPEGRLGPGEQLHRLRQVRSGLPHGALAEKGFSVMEIIKESDLVGRLARQKAASANGAL